MKISACLIVLNEAHNLPRCLDSLVGIADEVVVVDSASTDGTVEICLERGARVVQRDWHGYVAQKNFAIDQATYPWVLSIDADEEISPSLRESILSLKQVDDEGSLSSGFTFSRLVWYRGSWIRHGDWFPDRLVRLFRRSSARFAGGSVHERLEITGPCPLLDGPLHHFTYRDEVDRERRMRRYAALWAQDKAKAGRKASEWSGPSHACFSFLRGYILRRGFLDGEAGFYAALGNAKAVYWKYQALHQASPSC